MKSLRERVTTILSSQLTLIGLVLLFAVMLFELSQIAYKHFETEKEISDYEKEITKLQEQQGQLKELLEFLNTDYFAEREARMKLGMQAPNERMVIVSREQSIEQEQAPVSENDRVSLTEQPGQASVKLAENPDISQEEANKKSNPSRWGDYFFGDTE